MALPDLQSLDRLLLALPCALRLFHDEGPRILEGVLNHAVKAESMAEQVTETMRLVSLVQSPASLAVDAAGLDAFKDEYIHNDTVKLKPNPPSTKAPPLPVIFSNPAPGFSARKLLLLSRRITSLAYDCFDFFHDQWKQATPQHLANPRDSYRDGRPRLPWRKSFQGCPYEFDPGGPPYWIEMQHILDGLWNVQLTYELNNAAKEARLPWPAADVALAGTLDPSTLFRLDRLEAVVSVLFFLSQTKDAHSVFRQLSRGFSDSPLQLPRPSARHWPETTNLRKGPLHDCGGYSFVCAQIHSNDFISPFRDISFSAFRPLGLGLWSQSRLITGELVSQPLDVPGPPRAIVLLSPSNKLFTWRSLLRREDIDAHVAQLEAEVGRTQEGAPVT
ncbi:hypothetical protein S7711_10199 [Stachybotrys chartarum IBT 7711]|uniref:Uncharacterized protein n=1 Tax=Stachybotrys chartarum (strain CBS 109288 / IBT 7711) TaxID=1280523 RepID=A0A084B8M9_STACB|nr:hypothetical protein S7711_10199 [Stachybotrys chartarum IBT 7711]